MKISWQRISALAVVAAVVLAVFIIRHQEAGYHAILHQDHDAAREGLARLAEGGDGTAAYFMGHLTRKTSKPAAEKWYLKSAQLGQDRAIPWYVQLKLQADTGPENCKIAEEVLERLESKARTVVPATFLGDMYLHRIKGCFAKDMVRGAYYYYRAGQVDKRLNGRYQRVLKTLTRSGRKRLDGFKKAAAKKAGPLDAGPFDAAPWDYAAVLESLSKLQ